jgi:hypothetical protein
MNKIINIFLLSLSLICFSACEIDNYDAPDATIVGQVYDQAGNPLQTALGQGNMKIRIKEISFAHGDSNVVVTEQDLNMMMDGSFKNTRLFAGTYEMWPYETCGYPCEEEQKKVVELKSGKTTEVQFTVIPYLTLEWVDEPYQDEDGYIRASFKFTRNAKEGYSMPDVEKAQLLVGTTIASTDARYTDNTVPISNIQEGDIIQLKSKAKIEFTQKLFLRISANCMDTYKKSCFTDIKTIDAKGFGR